MLLSICAKSRLGMSINVLQDDDSFFKLMKLNFNRMKATVYP